MPRHRSKVEKRNKRIDRDYNRMNVSENGVRKFTHEYIVGQLAEKYFLAEATIDNILSGHGYRTPKKQFVDPRQGSLFADSSSNLHPQS